MQADIVVLPGDGIGPEVTAAAVRGAARGRRSATATTSASSEQLIGGAAIDATGDAAARRHAGRGASAPTRCCSARSAGRSGPIRRRTVRPEQGLLAIRKALGLYANLRPVKPHPAALGASPIKPHLLTGVDLLVVRELTGGIYFGAQDSARADSRQRPVRLHASPRSSAWSAAPARWRASRRGHVTSVDKANVLETSRLWREVATRVVRDEFPDVTLEHQLVDSMAMHLLAKPREFDVIVTENMFGDILTDEASMLAGSLGLLPSASLGDGRVGLYEPIHGSAPDIAGRGIANPYATILSAAMLLRHSLGLEDEARCVEKAVGGALDAGVFTADIAAAGRGVSTQAATAAVLEQLSVECEPVVMRD